MIGAAGVLYIDEFIDGVLVPCICCIDFPCIEPCPMPGVVTLGFMFVLYPGDGLIPVTPGLFVPTPGIVVELPGVVPIPVSELFGAGVIVVLGVIPPGVVVFDALPWLIPDESPLALVEFVPGVAPVPGAGVVLVPLLDDMPAPGAADVPPAAEVCAKLGDANWMSAMDATDNSPSPVATCAPFDNSFMFNS